MILKDKTHTTRKTTGFTIVELLIVVVVIAILAAITIVAYNGVTQQAKASSAQSAASQAMKKIATHKINEGSVPTTLDALSITSDGTINYQYSVDTSTTPNGYCVSASTGGVTYYLGENYTYTVNGGGTINQLSPITGACPGHNANGIPTITNFATNPGAEVDVIGFGAPNSSSVARSTIRAHSGAASTLVTMPAGASSSTVGTIFFSLSNFIGTLEPYTWYTVSAWVYVPTGTTNLHLAIQGAGRNSSTLRNPATRQATVKDQWVRIDNSFETTASGNVNLLAINTVNTPGTSTQFWIDDVMVVKGVVPYNFADGSTDGWTWNGTAGKSSSYGPVSF